MSHTVTAAEFKAKCLKLMDEVAASGDSVIITKRGKPVACLTPASPQPRPILGAMKGRIQILGELIEPIDVDWEAQQ
jgi:prevent-host-death family protein